MTTSHKFEVSYTKTFTNGNMEGISVEVRYGMPNSAQAAARVAELSKRTTGKDFGTQSHYTLSNISWNAR